MSNILLEVSDLVKVYPSRSGHTQIRAVDGVSLSLARGQTIGIVGESGCGKSTLGRLILQLIEPTSGQVRFRGQQLTMLPESQLRAMRRHMQMIFQDPLSALDPRMTVGALVEEPLVIHHIGTKAERRTEVARLLEMVGLSRDAMQRYPHEFSGGQRQRICIARALALSPDLIVADEPVSALDVSVQSQILNLIIELKQRLGLSYVFISHNLAVVRYISDTVAVMYLGQMVETGTVEQVFESPSHPYTQALLAAIPKTDPTRKFPPVPLSGELPSPENPPSGCRFHPRCPQAHHICRTEVPRVTALGLVKPGHTVMCHLF